MKIAVLGAGNMGGALVRGWARAGMSADLIATANTQTTLDRIAKACPEVTVSLDNREAVQSADVVILAVKPWLIETVINEVKAELGAKTVVSVAANVRHERIDIYAMPNIAAEFGQSMTFVEAPANVQDGMRTVSVGQVVELFEAIGQCQVVPQKLMGAGMMMAGCGIAYVMRFLRAMMEGGVEMGFYPDDAQRIAMQTMQGAVTLLAETSLHPESAIDKVTTPGGVTIKGLNEMEHAGLSSAVIRSLKAGLK